MSLPAETARVALITGVTGQDGRLLARRLLDRGYRVVGVSRNAAAARDVPSMPADARFVLVESPQDSEAEFARLLSDHAPDEVYNLGSQSSPEVSWRLPLETGDATGMGAHRLFDAVRRGNFRCRVYQASSSEMYGDSALSPQDEATPMHPVNPYAAAKVYAHHVARIYRESFGQFIACGILFNHESPLRPMRYLTQRITYGAACAKLGIVQSPMRNADGTPVVDGGWLSLGNLDAQRDWGAAVDYVEAMRRNLQHDDPGEFVIGTGIARSVRDLCEIGYGLAGLDWREHVRSDARLLRPADSGPKVANPHKAMRVLGWSPTTTIESVLEEMVALHLASLESSA
jgi:GDPmannose 4,6-dehydratase